MAADLKRIYTTATEAEAAKNRVVIEAKWHEAYPPIAQSWRKNNERGLIVLGMISIAAVANLPAVVLELSSTKQISNLKLLHDLFTFRPSLVLGALSAPYLPSIMHICITAPFELSQWGFARLLEFFVFLIHRCSRSANLRRRYCQPQYAQSRAVAIYFKLYF